MRRLMAWIPSHTLTAALIFAAILLALWAVSQLVGLVCWSFAYGYNHPGSGLSWLAASMLFAVYMIREGLISFGKKIGYNPDVKIHEPEGQGD